MPNSSPSKLTLWMEYSSADLDNSTSATISQNRFQRRITLGAICREGWRRVKPRRYPGPRVSGVSTAPLQALVRPYHAFIDHFGGAALCFASSFLNVCSLSATYFL